MRLYPIRALGIQAYCSDLIVDCDDPETVYFLSIAGYHAAVKGILANLLENSTISIEVDGNSLYLTRAGFGYKAMVKKLPSGLVHAVLFPKLALPNPEEASSRFFIVTAKKEELLTLFFRHLDERTDIPLHPSWAGWLWKTFEAQEGWVFETETIVGSYQGYLFEFHHRKLHDLVSEAITKRVPEVIECMQWKGGKASGKPDYL